MRYGFTTGSCAAAAAKAAAYMLFSGKIKEKITIQTPKGIPFHAQIVDIQRSESCVSCGVVKDGGDDPDITTGTIIYASVSVESGEEAASVDLSQQQKKDGLPIIYIDGGLGVGRVTKPGLDQPVGNAAINHVPREMIEREVRQVCELLDYQDKLWIEISAPAGVELAEKTFNPRLGIVGGISILGTSGIVEPMSSQALLDTIYVELRQKYAMGKDIVAVSPGNYGLDYMKRAYDFDLDTSVKCSNYIGQTIDMACDIGFHKMLLTGHIGKLVKVAGGIMNTHSKEGDCRMEILVAAAVRQHVPVECLEAILDCVTTEEAVRILNTCDKKDAVMSDLVEKIMFYLNKRGAGKIQIEVILYSNEFGELGKSTHAKQYLDELY